MRERLLCSSAAHPSKTTTALQQKLLGGQQPSFPILGVKRCKAGRYEREKYDYKRRARHISPKSNC